MSFSDVKYCIICDDVRVEQEGKLTILGFYGLSPTASIALQAGQQTKLAFVAGVGRLSGTHIVSMRVLGPDHAILMELAPVTHNLEGFEQAYNHLVCYFNNISFRQAGVHTFQLVVDAQLKFSGPFNIFTKPQVK